MKLSIAWLLAMASFTVLVDSISIKSDDYALYPSDEEEMERDLSLNEQEFGVDDLNEEMDSEEDAKCTNSTIAICKPFTESKILKVLGQLGATQNPAIQIVNASESFLKELKKNNGTLKATQRKRRSSNNNQMCSGSVVVESFELIHPYVSLVYQVSGVTCVDNFCFSSPNCAPINPIGGCVVTKRQVVLHLFNNDGALYPKTIDVGAACKCSLYS